MIRIIGVVSAALLLALVALLPMQRAQAQSNSTLGGALLGGAAGAIIGGAATGKAGGAIAGGVIGAAAGAILGSQLEHRRGHYYWYDGRCWRRNSKGDYYRVAKKYCY